MTALPESKLPYDAYLAQEATSSIKHEYLAGAVWAMAGGTVEHGRLQAAVVVELGLALRGKPCVVLSSDVRVRIDATDRSTYPDASVVCGKREVSAVDADAIVNPRLIVEVLSDSTERDDRGEKFAHYRRLPSLQEYVLVNQNTHRIEVFRREEDGWLLTEAGGGQRVSLRSIGAELDVDAVYFDPLLAGAAS